MEAITKVMQTLEAMVAAHLQMLDVTKAKRKTLLKGDIAGLQRLLPLELKYTAQIEQLEEQRQTEVQALLRNTLHAGDSYTLEQLLNNLDDTAAKTKLEKIADQLRSLVQEIAELNETNQQLIQASLSYVQYSLGLFVQNEPAIGYGPKAAKRYANLLDAKI